MSLLRLDGVSRRFRGLVAVDNVSLTVEPGAIFAIIGPNGAGKTTLFSLIAGALAVDSGRIEFGGARIDGLRPDQICMRGLARTFQIVRPFPALSVHENAAIGVMARESDVGLAFARAEDSLRAFDLWDKRHQRASSLTLPDRKRLEMARALATRPKMLLLDETMAGLRPPEVDRVVETLRALNRDTGLTIVMIEHVMRAVTSLADRVHVLNHGATIAEGPPEQVMRDPKVIASYLGAEALG
jgi:branched-chain amino acid transport system ATP-binding protein